MYMRLCPDGSEGASYAMLTTFGNIALVSIKQCLTFLVILYAHIYNFKYISVFVLVRCVRVI